MSVFEDLRNGKAYDIRDPKYRQEVWTKVLLTSVVEHTWYDALGNASDKAVALQRIREIRRRGLGVVAWIVADDSDDYRQKIFNAPTKYAFSLADFFPYLSYIVLGLEMDEGKGSAAQWTALRDAVRKAGWTGKIATHHTAGNRDFISLGDIVMDQLDTDCTPARIASSVKKLISKGKDVCGFEYSRDPDRTKAQAALDAGAFGCGNWSGK